MFVLYRTDVYTLGLNSDKAVVSLNSPIVCLFYKFIRFLFLFFFFRFLVSKSTTRRGTSWGRCKWAGRCRHGCMDYRIAMLLLFLSYFLVLFSYT